MKACLLGLLLALAGCATTGDYAECLIPVRRDAGMGVLVEGCVAWRIGRLK